MFDDLRKEGDASPFFEASDVEPLLDAPKKKTGGLSLNIKTGGKFLGMTAVQRFIISALVMVMAGVLGLMLLLVTGKLNLPF